MTGDGAERVDQDKAAQPWTEGYVDGISYIRSFYRELSPTLLRFALLLAGHRPPVDLEGPFHYAELGCGHGVTSAVLAAAHPCARFDAVDFNPDHIAGARRLANDAGLDNATFREDSFADLLDQARADSSDGYDIIALHGIWSWVSERNREILVELLRRRLKPGGLVFLTYNALPGTYASLPLRRLLVEHTSANSGPLPQRIGDALGFATRLTAEGYGWFGQYDSLPSRIEGLKQKSANYIAHEYLNRDWTAFYHADVARTLAAAKLRFAGSAVPMEQVDALTLPDEALAPLAEARDPDWRETLRDMLINRSFRRDLYIKGSDPLSAPERRAMLGNTHFMLLVDSDDVPEVISTPTGRITLDSAFHQAVIKKLGEEPQSLDDLARLEADGDLSARFTSVLDMLVLLVSLGLAAPCLTPEARTQRQTSTRRFNDAVLERCRYDDTLLTLASPILGSGVSIARIEGLFALAIRKGMAPASFAAASLAGPDPSTEVQEDYQRMLGQFERRRRPLLTRLGVL